MNLNEQLRDALKSKKKVTLGINVNMGGKYIGQQDSIVGLVTLVRPNAIGFIQDTPFDTGTCSSKTFSRVIMIEHIFEVVV